MTSLREPRAMPIWELLARAGAAGISGVIGYVMFEVWWRDEPLEELAVWWILGAVCLLLLVAGLVLRSVSSDE